MSEPSQEFLRRGEVFDWLVKLGIRRSTVIKMIDEKVIEGEPVRVNRNDPAANTSKRKWKQHRPGGAFGPRCYFRKSQIKEKLKL